MKVVWLKLHYTPQTTLHIVGRVGRVKNTLLFKAFILKICQQFAMVNGEKPTKFGNFVLWNDKTNWIIWLKKC